jgi:ketosteroid isomerase-like protein
MTEQQKHMEDEVAIRDLIENWASAVRRKDFNGIFRHHSADMLMFDVPPPLESKGIAAYKATWDLFYAWSPEPVVFKINEMTITAGNDVAFVTALMSCVTREVNGDYVDLDFRLTTGLRKIDERWIIVHEHHSIPATQ